MENKQVKHLVQHINVLLKNDQQWLNNLHLNQKIQYIYYQDQSGEDTILFKIKNDLFYSFSKQIILHTFIIADIRSFDVDIKCGCPTRRQPIITDARRI